MIINLAGVKLYLNRKIKSIFIQKTDGMNLVGVTKFFYITYEVLFMSLLAVDKVKKRLLEPISQYFATVVQTNRYKIYHLHCCIWLRKASYLAMLYYQMKENLEFCQKILFVLGAN